jgi:predicted 3-demethylubiquinone-9 3-methyltransferase (glyoxalase superfamily)
MTMQTVTTFLTFKEKAEEAANFYVSLFKNSKIANVTRSEQDGPIPKGAALNVSFQLDGQEFMAMDGGPHFRFEEGFSLFVNCETQEEIDRLWDKLSEGGGEQACGWVKDKYGVSWQIIPSILGELMTDKDADKAKRVIDVMLKMQKIDIKALQEAYDHTEETVAT